MTWLYLGCLLFGGTHLFSILFPGLRDSFRTQFGVKPWKGLYALVSLAGLVLMVIGYGQSRAGPATADLLYEGWYGGRHLTMLLVLLAFILIGASHGKGLIVGNKGKARRPIRLGRGY